MDWIDLLLSRSGLLSVLSGIFEGLGVPWPGAVLLAAAGTASADAVATALLALAFTLTYTGAAWLQYLAGRYLWRFLERWIPQAQQNALFAFMQKHGELAVLWTRPLAVGNYISVPAGIVRMHQGKFLLYSFLGILPWALGITYGGSYVGARLSAATQILTWAAVVMGLIGSLVAIRRAILARRATPKADEESTEPTNAFAD